MSSDSSSRRSTDPFGLPADDRVSRPDGGKPPDHDVVSFTRKKFLWLDKVRADPELTPLAFMLAYVLADLVNEREGCAWPSVARLAAECRVTERGVQKIIGRLVERGHLNVELGNGRGETNRYRWIVGSGDAHHASDVRNQTLAPCNDGKTQPASRQSDQKGRTIVHPFAAERVNHGSQKGEQPFRKGRTPVHPTQSNESIYDPSYRLSPRVSAQSPPNGFDAFWRVYPKKVALTEAIRAFARAIERAPPEEVIRGAMRYAVARDGEDPRYTKNPATWLNKACWRDQTTSSRGFPGDGPSERRQFDRSALAQLHDDGDFDEVLARIQQRRNERG